MLDRRLVPLRADDRFKLILEKSKVEFADMLKDLDAAKARGELPKYLEAPLAKLRKDLSM